MLQELLTTSAVKLNLESEDKDELFEEMTEVLFSLCPGLDRSEVLDSLMDRESKMTTGVVPGIAVPHAVNTKLSKPLFAIGISKKGIDFESLDGKPVHVVFMFLFPTRESGTHLKIMQQLVSVFGVPNFYKNLVDKTNAADVIKAIGAAEESL